MIIALMTMVTTTYAQHLTARQKHLATISALAASGDIERLYGALKEGLDDGLTVNEIKETLSHLYAYVGFPRALNSLGTLEKVQNDFPQSIWQEGEVWLRPALWDDAALCYAQGVENQTKMAGKRFDYYFCPQVDYYLKAHLFGAIFAGKALTAADREIVTVAALSAIKGAESQLTSHKAGAVRMGNTEEIVAELCQYLSANGLSNVDFAADAWVGAWKKGEANVAYAQYFVGDSYLAPLRPKNMHEGEETALKMSNVTFEPGCRNNWHIHYGARQILICVAGKGWYQEWGKAAIELKEGDVVDIPEGVKHWHGAQKDTWFAHIATHVAVESSKPDAVPNVWLEAVSDEEYERLH